MIRQIGLVTPFLQLSSRSPGVRTGRVSTEFRSRIGKVAVKIECVPSLETRLFGHFPPASYSSSIEGMESHFLHPFRLDRTDGFYEQPAICTAFVHCGRLDPLQCNQRRSRTVRSVESDRQAFRDSHLRRCERRIRYVETGSPREFVDRSALRVACRSKTYKACLSFGPPEPDHLAKVVNL